MGVMPTPAQSERYAGLLPVDDWSDEAPVRADEWKNDRLRAAQPSPGRRGSRTPVRFVITFCVGIAGTLAWQSYSDAARQVIASLSPQLGWLAPHAAAAKTGPDMGEQIARNVDRIVAASQEQITRRVDHLAAGQEQMTREILRLQAISQYAAAKNPEPPHKSSEPPPRPASVRNGPRSSMVRQSAFR